jgi:hypothetical protein
MSPYATQVFVSNFKTVTFPYCPSIAALVPLEFNVTPGAPEIVTLPEPNLITSTLYPLSIASVEFDGILITEAEELSTVITLPASETVTV